MTDQPTNERTGVEPDVPPSGKLFFLLGSLTVLVALIAIGMWQLFQYTVRSELQAKDLGVENPMLAEQRAKDVARLTSWDVIDAEAGRYRLPIDQAMASLVAHPERIGPVKLESEGGEPTP